MIANIVGSSDMPLAAGDAADGRQCLAAALQLLLLLQPTCSCFLRVGRGAEGERGCNTSFSLPSC